MSAQAGAALKTLQWVLRALQLTSAALILAIYSYFLATLHNHNFSIPTSVRAVEGISGIAVAYTLGGILLVCCVAGFMLTSLLAMFLDVAFIGAFIYVATANKGGASSCTGYLDTPFGKGKADKKAKGDGGFTALPSFHTACKLQTACLAVSIILIFLFIFSIATELFLARHHQKEKRFGPGPGNDYTSGYPGEQKGFFARLFGKNKDATPETDSILPHTTPDQLEQNPPMQQHQQQQSSDTYSFAPGDDTGYNGGGIVAEGEYIPQPYKYESGYGYPTAGYGVNNTTATNNYDDGYRPPPNRYSYDDGVYDRR